MICFLGLVLAACPGFVPRVTSDEPRLPVDPAEQARIRAQLADVRAQAANRTSLRAYARARIQAEAGTARVREVIAAERPARLRVETLNFLGQAQSLLVADGDEATFFDGQQIVRGERPSVLLRELGMDLGPAEAIDLLLAAPAIPDAAPQHVWSVGAGHLIEFARHRVELSEAGELTRVDALDAAGRLRWTVEFGSWSDVAGGRYPLEIRAYFPRTELRAEFAFEDVELNTSLDAGLFRLARTPE